MSLHCLFDIAGGIVIGLLAPVVIRKFKQWRRGSLQRSAIQLALEHRDERWMDDD